MNVAGHLAVACLASRQRAAFIPAAFGTLMPDVIDKSAQLAGFTPYGRTWGHSLLAWLPMLAVFVIVPALRRSRATGWLIAGALLHLLVDLIDDVVEGLERSGWVFSGWFAWPITNPDMWNVAAPHAMEPMHHATTSLELAAIAACVVSALRARAQERRPSSYVSP